MKIWAYGVSFISQYWPLWYFLKRSILNPEFVDLKDEIVILDVKG